MTSLVFKVNERIGQELDFIKEEEGLGNRTSAFTFLIKYYLLTKNRSLEKSIALMDKLLEKIDMKALPSLEDQLSDV